MLLTGTSQALEVTVDHVTVRVADSVASPAPKELRDAAQEHLCRVQAQSGFFPRLWAALMALFSREPNMTLVDGKASDFALTDPRAAARPREISLESLGLANANDENFWVVSARKAGFAGVDWAWGNEAASYPVIRAHVTRKDGTRVDAETQLGAFKAFGDSLAARRAGELAEGKKGFYIGLFAWLLPVGKLLHPDTYSFGTDHILSVLAKAPGPDHEPLRNALYDALDAALFPPRGTGRKPHVIAINGVPIPIGTADSEKRAIINATIQEIEAALANNGALLRQVFAAIIGGRAGMDIVSRGNGMPQFTDNTHETCRIDIWTPLSIWGRLPPAGEVAIQFAVDQGDTLSAGARVTLGPKVFRASQLDSAAMETTASYSLTAANPSLTIVQCVAHFKPVPCAASTLPLTLPSRYA
ncbi:hypothetical protein PSP31121_05264 [Pandoraea sputorum]|uniref:Uncharacterized protein n=2 Tax=Pandoraea sputorum TaxID=93222 RepID=A0A5E5BHY4_9BURK|nr:hypothetical protein PSP31121_05264 [Pandoraea sputorum]